MDTKQFLSAIEQIAEEKGLSREQIVEAIEVAVAAAYKKEYGRRGQNIKVDFDIETGKTRIFQVKLVVDESMLKPETEGETLEEAEKEEEEIEEMAGIEKEGENKLRFNPERHIMLPEARKIKKGIKPGEELKISLEEGGDYGRIAAQTAKQVITQRLREAERDVIYSDYKGKEGELVSGLIQRVEGRNIFIDIGKATGVLLAEEQIPRENYRIGSRLKVYVLKVEKDARGATGILLSRAHPQMVAKLFELEVPEISSGAVEIKSIAREPGSRSKIAVFSKSKDLDAVGSCVGGKGIRVQTVINELGGEKIDIIEWAKDEKKFVANALSPAKVNEVKLNKDRKEAVVRVPEDQLSLAIGRDGQNVRLAAKLTGWKINAVGEEREGVKEIEKKEEEKKVKPKKKAKVKSKIKN